MVALLRGVNVGRANRIRMADLRQVATEAGLDGATTYIQSGNLIFTDPAGRAPARLETHIEHALAEAFETAIAVIIRTGDELAATADALPDKMLGHNPRHLSVAFFKHPPADDHGRIDPDRAPADQIVVRAREAFIAYAEGASRSKLTPGYLENELGTPITMRNWNTVTRLVSIAGGLG